MKEDANYGAWGGRLRRHPRTAILVLVLAAFAVASILSMPDTSRPRGRFLSGAQISPEVLAILRRSCQDCHSGETHYPWYSYVAPVSWLIASDVARGRERLNLSMWSEYPFVRRLRSLSEIANQVQDGEMPLRQYTLIHRNARVSQIEVRAIFEWTQTERNRLIAENGGSAP